MQEKKEYISNRLKITKLRTKTGHVFEVSKTPLTSKNHVTQIQPSCLTTHTVRVDGFDIFSHHIELLDDHTEDIDYRFVPWLNVDYLVIHRGKQFTVPLKEDYKENVI